MELPFEAEQFDVITAFETVYFWPGLEETFAQVYKVLKTGGTFMICNESCGKNQADEKWTKMIETREYKGFGTYSANDRTPRVPVPYYWL